MNRYGNAGPCYGRVTLDYQLFQLIKGFLQVDETFRQMYKSKVDDKGKARKIPSKPTLKLYQQIEQAITTNEKLLLFSLKIIILNTLE